MGQGTAVREEVFHFWPGEEIRAQEWLLSSKLQDPLSLCVQEPGNGSTWKGKPRVPTFFSLSAHETERKSYCLSTHIASFGT